MLFGRWIAASLVLAGSATARAQARPDSSGAIVGIVTMKEGGFPLAYSVVSAPALGQERFSNDQGVFTLTALPAGPLQLRVRHLGYAPVDLPVVVHAGGVDTVRVALAHIAVHLAVMEVHGYPACKSPGAPKASNDSAFAAVFDQLHQNAEQYRMLTQTYPFVSSVERAFFTSFSNGESRLESTDTTVASSSNIWTYRPGSVIEGPRGLRRLTDKGNTTMNIPTLVTFADPIFVNNHCFYNGGLESIDGVDLLRVDFMAAQRIADPDVDGSMYLDPSTFQIRRSVLRLSRIPIGMRGLVATEAVSYFGEVLPSIPLIYAIESVNRFSANATRPESPTSAKEQQRLIGVRFLKGKPGDEPKKPDTQP